MNVLFEDSKHISTYWFEGDVLITRCTDKISGAYCENVYDPTFLRKRKSNERFYQHSK